MLPRHAIAAVLRSVRIELQRPIPNGERAKAAVDRVIAANKPEEFSRDTYLASLNLLGTRELGYLEQIKVETVGDLLAVDEAAFKKVRGIGLLVRSNIRSAQESIARQLREAEERKRAAMRDEVDRRVRGTNTARTE